MSKDFSQQLTDALRTYTTEVTEAIEKKSESIAKDAVKELKARSPVRTGGYASGWTLTRQDGALVIYNSKKPGLTHLLEKGHALRRGGRAPGKPHVGPVEEQVIKKYEKAVESIIEEGV